jgi:hypothetical protein
MSLIAKRTIRHFESERVTHIMFTHTQTLICTARSTQLLRFDCSEYVTDRKANLRVGTCHSNHVHARMNTDLHCTIDTIDSIAACMSLIAKRTFESERVTQIMFTPA